MLFEYETQRLLLKIIKPEYGSSVLEFYLRDKALFERYEPDRIHRRLLARSVFSIFCMRLVVVARQVTNSPAGFIITDMQRRH